MSGTPCRVEPASTGTDWPFFRIERNQHALLDGLLRQVLLFRLGAVTPEKMLGFRQGDGFPDPFLDVIVRRQRAAELGGRRRRQDLRHNAILGTRPHGWQTGKEGYQILFLGKSGGLVFIAEPFGWPNR